MNTVMVLIGGGIALIIVIFGIFQLDKEAGFFWLSRDHRKKNGKEVAHCCRYFASGGFCLHVHRRVA